MPTAPAVSVGIHANCTTSPNAEVRQAVDRFCTSYYLIQHLFDGISKYIEPCAAEGSWATHHICRFLYKDCHHYFFRISFNSIVCRYLSACKHCVEFEQNTVPQSKPVKERVTFALSSYSDSPPSSVHHVPTLEVLRQQ